MSIDLNADLGDGFGVWRLGDDDALLEVVTSANVACGFHAGDPAIMRRICERAAQRGVAVGAQVGYRDLAGFGRRRIEVPPEDLAADVLYQVGALAAIARAAGTRVRYVKAHGALYNTAADDPMQAAALAAAVADFDVTMPLLGLPLSQMQDAALAAGLHFFAEAFADRAYLPNGRLVPRTQAGAVHDDRFVILAQAVSIARFKRVTAIDGTQIPIDARSLCIHGDTPDAAQLARQIRVTLDDAKVSLAPFVA